LTTKVLAAVSHRLTLLFHQGILDRKQHGYFVSSSYSPDLTPWDFSLFPQFKLKFKGCHFDTIKVIEAESQAMLDTLTGHDFQNALKMGEAMGTVHTCGATSRAIVASKPNVIF
jgi:hypothetical protein